MKRVISVEIYFRFAREFIDKRALVEEKFLGYRENLSCHGIKFYFF